MASNTLFQNIYKKAVIGGATSDFTTQASIDWYRKNVRKMQTTSTRLFKESKDHMINSWTNVGPGQLYFATYDPKHKKTLPYYDTTPCIIPIERYTTGDSRGILALNLHYLPPILRARLLDELYGTLTNKNFDDKTKMKVNYEIMKRISKGGIFKPTIKRYLGKHFRSRFIRVHPENWNSAIFLPLENFNKASKSKVWSDSRRIIRG